MGVLIEDGYEEERTVPAFGHTPAVTFRYRPALPAAAYRYFKAPSANGDEALKNTAELLLAHLVGWDVTRKKPGGEPESVAISPEALQRVPHRVLELMATAVLGYSAE